MRVPEPRLLPPSSLCSVRVSTAALNRLPGDPILRDQLVHAALKRLPLCNLARVAYSSDVLFTIERVPSEQIAVEASTSTSRSTFFVGDRNRIQLVPEVPQALEPVLSAVSVTPLGGLDDLLHSLCVLILHRCVEADQIRTTVRISPPGGVLLSGPPGTGKSSVAKLAAQRCKVPLVHLSTSDCSDAYIGEAEQRLRETFVEAHAVARQSGRGCVLLIDEVDGLCPRRDGAVDLTSGSARTVALLLTLLDGVNGGENDRLVVLCTTNRPRAIDPALRRPGRLDREIAVPVPDAPARLHILRTLCASLPMRPQLDEQLRSVAARTPGFVGADLQQLVRSAALRALHRQRGGMLSQHSGLPGVPPTAETCASTVPRSHELCALDLEHALSETTPSLRRRDPALPSVGGDAAATTMATRMNAAAEEQATSTRHVLGGIGGLDEVKRRLMQAIDWPLRRSAACARLGLRPARGVLLYGPPGCGKTSLARSLASAAHLAFFYLSCSAVYSPYLGEAEQRLRDEFTRARQCSPAVLFLDELDALVSSRGAGPDGGGDAVQTRVLATLLTEMDGAAQGDGVLVVGATNRRDRLDSALLRPGRFDLQLCVPLPEQAAREQILLPRLERMCADRSAAATLAARLAARTDGYSGAQLDALCREAALSAIRTQPDCVHVDVAFFEQLLDADS